ncbi:hypothetical protein FORC88_4498 [Salmonella enterica subsp. enterica serovar Typhimurium]|nr:hypothetical protein CFSAN001692_17300 [Salmonella enterica subsp. enterica serovar Cerro str. CFSAN001692]ETC18624.1 hypothetical protein CFSAN001679_21250 [Salmonella enterica subsp. enterica serovar Cerro str. CFSAN001679]ETC47613.1 hypothetical protein CFSAN001670_21725 [Salmonella enterica subsp. enterica serovar Cerro str. CFSAN001670]ETC75997.1 hypothetical protein SEEC5569_10030 [Salmonella enterica subsp. enterica serovar Cerro str. 5569]OSJ86114.1 hypothetical protein K801_18962 [S
MKLQKMETLRQIPGTGKRSFTIPATMIGTEQTIVTRMVNTILNGSVIAASILVIINYSKVSHKRCAKRAQEADSIRKRC